MALPQHASEAAPGPASAQAGPSGDTSWPAGAAAAAAEPGAAAAAAASGPPPLAALGLGPLRRAVLAVLLRALAMVNWLTGHAAWRQWAQACLLMWTCWHGGPLAGGSVAQLLTLMAAAGWLAVTFAYTGIAPPRRVQLLAGVLSLGQTPGACYALSAWGQCGSVRLGLAEAAPAQACPLTVTAVPSPSFAGPSWSLQQATVKLLPEPLPAWVSALSLIWFVFVCSGMALQHAEQGAARQAANAAPPSQPHAGAVQHEATEDRRALSILGFWTISARSCIAVGRTLACCGSLWRAPAALLLDTAVLPSTLLLALMPEVWAWRIAVDLALAKQHEAAVAALFQPHMLPEQAVWWPLELCRTMLEFAVAVVSWLGSRA